MVAFLRSLIPAGVTAEVRQDEDEAEGAVLSAHCDNPSPHRYRDMEFELFEFSARPEETKMTL
jgi:hypothetical protein